jgi:AraC-like DNA-binding protein
MLYKEYLPAAQLRPYIKCYWVMQKHYAPGEQERVMPESCFELMFQRDGRFTLQGSALPELFIIGHLQGAIYLDGTSELTQFCARIWPWGLPPFGKLDALQGKKTADAAVVLHASTTDLIENLKNATEETFTSAFDEYFLTQLLHWRFTGDVIAQATEYIRLHQGVVKIKDLADYCFTSQRTLERSFNKEFHQAPQEMAAKVRFEQVRNSIIRQPRVSLADLAARFGYADQAHLTKDFRRFTGMLPSAFAKDIQAMQFEAEPNVAFLQDGDRWQQI